MTYVSVRNLLITIPLFAPVIKASSQLSSAPESSLINPNRFILGTLAIDPANGRMDIVPAEHRRRGGFSQEFIGTDSVFYSAGFAGSYNDLRILAHESTHAVHRQLMNRRACSLLTLKIRTTSLKRLRSSTSFCC